MAETVGIRVHNLRKTFQRGRVQACRNVNLQLAEGALMVLLGPSGCGKTTTLRCIAGLEQPDNDDAIWVKGRNITRLQPKDRNLAFVFQDTALFPHLSIRRNISFGLDMHKNYPRAERQRRVNEVAGLLHVEDLLERKPHEVSGGQAQRVALGRAIVMEPDAFLLDEPLANLDAALRVEMRTEIKRIQKRLGISTIFVTHDQEEALTLGDVIAVMKDGEVQQVGTSHDIYHHPANFFVATFIGSPPLNCLTSRMQMDNGTLSLVSQAFRLPVEAAGMAASLRGHEEVVLGIRPEFISISPERPDTIPARVSLIEPLGSRTIIFLEAEGVELRALVQGETAAREGEAVHLRLDLQRSFFFDTAGNRL